MTNSKIINARKKIISKIRYNYFLIISRDKKENHNIILTLVILSKINQFKKIKFIR